MIRRRLLLMNRSLVAVPVIIMLNALVFLLWLFEGEDTGFMADNFLVSWSSIAEGRYWTLLTSAFSHNLFFHIFLNMFVLRSFGGIVERYIGSFAFLRFYIVAGVLSSLCHAVTSQWLMHQPDMQALGASGAVSGVILIFALLFPREKILILGLIPVPAIFGALIAIGLDLWGLMAQAGGHGLPIGHGAHLGGAFTGVLYYLFVLRPKLRGATL